ncbi:MAG: hypothetical protein JST54_09595 [Deltaproteobacteria bacterium]|nr:hypothetical protein [Deltaproteobacteria bacterium]
MKTLSKWLCLAVLSGGCSGATATAPDSTALDRTAQALHTAVATHRANAAGAATPADCKTELDRYQAQVSPMVGQLEDGGAAFDACMDDLGHPAGADLGQTCVSMHDELAQYASQACTFTDMTRNRQLDGQHCDRMDTFAAHVRDRVQDMDHMGPGGGMMATGAGCSPMTGMTR